MGVLGLAGSDEAVVAASYNSGAAIQTVFDFTEDLEELEAFSSAR